MFKPYNEHQFTFNKKNIYTAVIKNEDRKYVHLFEPTLRGESGFCHFQKNYSLLHTRFFSCDRFW